MKLPKIFTLLIVLGMLLVAVVPAHAQLGDTDVSSFTVQNVDDVDATVTVHFVSTTGAVNTPTVLNASQPNPFTLGPGESFEVYLPGIASLPDGTYSVVIESTARVVTIANLIGSGARYLNGSYSGFDSGATTFFLPAVVWKFYGWYSLLSVQNVGDGPADVTVTITCDDGTVGTLNATDVPVDSSAHFDLEVTTPAGFGSLARCNGSAEVTSDQPVVVVDNQTNPAGGNMQSYSGVAGGASTQFAPALYTAYYGWNASINIRKLGAGDVDITVAYSDGAADSTCALTNANPGCLLYMPDVHPGANQYYGATITSNPATDLVVVVNAANGSQAQTYNGIGGGTGSVGIPSTMKSYYGWNTSFTCQNVGAVASTLHVAYAGYAANEYNTASLAAGDSLEVYTPGETFLPNSHQGAATVTANAAGAEIACIVNFNNGVNYSNPATPGDWSMSYNAFNK